MQFLSLFIYPLAPAASQFGRPGISIRMSAPVNPISARWHTPCPEGVITTIDDLGATELKCSAQKTMKTVLALLGVVTCAELALANPTISVNDNGGGLSTVPVQFPSGIVTYSGSDT
jgi:hypothetical protein